MKNAIFFDFYHKIQEKDKWLREHDEIISKSYIMKLYNYNSGYRVLR